MRYAFGEAEGAAAAGAVLVGATLPVFPGDVLVSRIYRIDLSVMLVAITAAGAIIGSWFVDPPVVVRWGVPSVNTGTETPLVLLPGTMVYDEGVEWPQGAATFTLPVTQGLIGVASWGYKVAMVISYR